LAVATVGQTVLLTATVAGGEPQSFAWDFGDGSTATTTTPKTPHVYKTKKGYTVTVTVTTTDGRSATGRVEFIAGI
jgi:PKD repeat protein